MRVFKFEITVTEDDLQGDEFWEDAISRDGTGIADLTDYLHNMIDESNLLNDRAAKDVVKLVSFTEE